jgi:hypothetical protein
LINLGTGFLYLAGGIEETDAALDGYLKAYKQLTSDRIEMSILDIEQ